MLKSLSLFAILSTGLLGAETITPQVEPEDVSFYYAGGRPVHTITLTARNVLPGSTRNHFAPISLISTNDEGQTVAWHLGMSQNSSDSADMFFQVTCNNFTPTSDTVFTGVVELEVFDEVTYSAPVELSLRGKEDGELVLDGHRLKLVHHPADEDIADVPHWSVERDGDAALAGLELTTPGGGKRICAFEEDEGRISLRLPSYIELEQADVRAIYGKGLHKVTVPLAFTVDFLCGAWGDVPAEFEHDSRCEEFLPPGVQDRTYDIVTDQWDRVLGFKSRTLQNIYSPLGVSFRECEMEVSRTMDDKGSYITAKLATPDPEAAGRNPHFATLKITASWATDTQEEIDTKLELHVPAYETVGEPLEVELAADGTTREISFAGRTYTATLAEANEDGDVELELHAPGGMQGVEILFNRKAPYPTGTDNEDRTVYTATIPGDDEEGYILSFSETKDREPVVIPVHVTGHTGVPIQK